MPDYNPSQYPTRKPREEAAAELRLNSELAEQGADPTRGQKSQLPQSTSSDSDHWRFSQGDVIAERFTVTQRLGRGGMGEVYAVIDQLKNEPRALKVMRAAIDGAGSSRERFLNESRVDDLRHPHIVRTIDIGEWKERKLLYITMELVDGQSLRQLMNGSERLSVVNILAICYQVCEALQFAHQHGVIHRDVKPDNVLVKLGSDGLHTWLTDFGIARLQTSGMTQTAAGMGTPIYMAPEQQESAAQVTGQADLYSVGAMLYELFTGQSPVGFLQPPSTFNNDLPKGTDDLVFDAMSRLPEHRIGDAGTMAARIGKLLKDLNQDLKSVTTSQVDPASINLGDLVFEIQPRKAPQVTIEGVPGIPEEILELEGKRDQIQQTLDLIEAETHPLVRDHQAGLEKLSEQVNHLQEQCQAKLPLQITGHEDEQLRDLILTGKAGPSEMLKIVPEANPEQLFQYVEVLINFITAEKTMMATQRKYEKQIHSETQRLEKDLQETKTQLDVKRKQDLETQIHAFFITFYKQHPKAKSFPYSAWGKFHGDVLAKRRYELTSIEMSLLAEQCFADLQNHKAVGDVSYNRIIVAGATSPILLSAPFNCEAAQQAQQKWADYLGSQVEFVNKIGMEFRLIPPGKFLMGSPAEVSEKILWWKKIYSRGEESRGEDEEQHKITLTHPYYLGVKVVTQGQWKAVMGTAPWKGKNYVKKGNDYPATYVSWEDAQEFIEKLNTFEGDLYRLPTEAEWEYACRAGSLSAYCFGDSAGELSNYGWFDENADDIGEEYAHQVGEKKPNQFGLYDMHGNVWEWCEDWYDDYVSGAISNPTGPTTGSNRVSRGGSWINCSGFCRSAYRRWNSPESRYYFLGFRVFRSIVK